MTDRNEPNEFGFAGGASGPEPEPAHRSPASDGDHDSAPDDRPSDVDQGQVPPADRPSELDEGQVAVPAGDLTGAVSDAFTEGFIDDDNNKATG
jgi:hypothetical protein